ncbi:MAG: HlyC/CorC family transporter [Rhodospirillales bacterium]|nr:HlyC/CorC family transporter [Rhodospirillales bacterium]
MRSLFKPKNGESTLRESLDELIDDREDAESPINASERALLENVLELRSRTIYDVMVPRADIVAVEEGTPFEAVVETMTGKGHSRLPVYRESLDDVVGMVHIKDLVAWRGRVKDFTLANVQRIILFVSPSMQVLELLLEMRVKRSHMAIVVDEHGGVDGLVTIEDLVEEIVGEIEDEHDRASEPDFTERADGTFEADARVSVDMLEATFGVLLDDDEREDIDTLGGLVISLTGHVPIRGELVRHPVGIEFQVIDADPRRIKRVRIRWIETPVVDEE